MDSSDLNRRGFLQTSAAAAAVGAAAATSQIQAAELSRAEIAAWQNRVGSRFVVGDCELQLKSVTPFDHTGDTARPGHLRPRSVSLLFVAQSGSLAGDQTHFLHHDGQKMLVSRVVAPQNETGEYFESIVN